MKKIYDSVAGMADATRTAMSRPARLRSFDYVGTWRYFLTVCTWPRVRVFTDATTVDSVWGHFRRSAEQQHFEIIAYCFMPDHTHFLVEGVDASADFRRFVHLAKQHAGWRYKQICGQRLWQENYHERVLRSAESTPSVAAYILGNRIRARLVERVEDYPYWGSGIYTREELIEYVASRA